LSTAARTNWNFNLHELQNYSTQSLQTVLKNDIVY